MSSGYRYHRVSPSFWTDPKVLAWDDRTRLLALYIMTCEHRITEGLFRLPKAYICSDLGWDEDTLSEPFAILLRDGFIKYDETVSVMLLTNALKWNPTNNDKHAVGATKAISMLPETPLLWDLIRYAERYDIRLYKQLVKRYGIPQALSQALTQTQKHPHARVREDDVVDVVEGDDVDDVLPSESDDSDPEQWHAFEQRFAQAFGGTPSPAHFEEVDDFVKKGMSLDAVVEAVRITALNKARSWGYTRRILESWAKEKLHTLEQVQAAEQRRVDTRASPPTRAQGSGGLQNAMRAAEEILSQEEGAGHVAL